MRPVSIIRFEQAYLAALLLGMLNMILLWDSISATYAADPNTAVLGSGFLIGSLTFSYVLSLLLWYLTARKASNVAKWILVIFLVIGALSALYSITAGTLPEGVSGVIAVVALVLQAAALYFLFRPDARAWFASDDVEGTFE